jgi:uncharacterized protein with NRDE domain
MVEQQDAGTEHDLHSVLLQEVMSDSRPLEDNALLPVTGMPVDVERIMSSIFIQPTQAFPGGLYGTRSQTILAVGRDGQVQQWERSITDKTGNTWQLVTQDLNLTGPSGQQPRAECNACQADQPA